MRDEQFRGLVLFAEHARHQRLLNPGQDAVGHSDRRCAALLLTRRPPSPKDLPASRVARIASLLFSDGHRELYLASSEIEHGIRRLYLPEDGPVRGVFYNGLPARDSGEEGFPIERPAFLVCRCTLSPVTSEFSAC